MISSSKLRSTNRPCRDGKNVPSWPTGHTSSCRAGARSMLAEPVAPRTGPMPQRLTHVQGLKSVEHLPVAVNRKDHQVSLTDGFRPEPESLTERTSRSRSRAAAGCSNRRQTPTNWNHW
uniref:(northern house mosquito) hypothetical protein n=1 Tax=Culex pipiens TaxID=7175 RepID=A0A8D8KCI1_CULPI